LEEQHRTDNHPRKHYEMEHSLYMSEFLVHLVN